MARLRFTGLDLAHVDPDMRARSYTGRGGVWAAGDEREIEDYHAIALLADYPAAFESVGPVDASAVAPPPVEIPGLTSIERAKRKPGRPRPTPTEG